MREAVAAIFVYETEIFIIRRQNYLRAFPGFYAFPGGKVDPEDRSFDYHHPLLSSFSSHQLGALCRELEEELGFDLTAALDQNRVKRISHFGEAVTPAFEKTRFNAHYFKIEMKQRPELVADNQEIDWCGWVDHRQLYQEYLEGRAMMVVPTMHTVRALASDVRVGGTEPFNLEYDAEKELPYVELINGVGLVPVPSNTLPPAKTTNALIIGDQGCRRFLVDPSPESERVYRQLKATIRRASIDAILITHHHHDHHELAPQLSQELGLPLCCTRETRDFMLQVQGDDYLDGVGLEFLSEAEQITCWLGHPVRCYSLPGHDAGMLGLAPDNMAWFFVADLAQAGATVVIPERGGDMRLYFDSLQRVIDLEPRAIIPSHGMPVGGTRLLQKTLSHRVEREQQILDYINSGLEIEGIIEMIYSDLNPRLKSLALQNVKQHIRKLEADGLLGA